jgi:AcrR family transcriptional regulator
MKKIKAKKNTVKVAIKPKKIRDYNNSARSEKSNVNRQKIIELYVNLLVEGGGQDVPLQALAKKSKTSMRTLFRFFGDKESLNLEIDNYLAQYLVSVADNLGKMKFEDYAAYSYKIFDEYEKLFKAYLYTNFGQKSRILFRKKYNEMAAAKLQSEIKLDPTAVEMQRIYFIISLINANLWKDIKDSFDMSGVEISNTVKWAMQSLIQNVRKPN